MQTDTSFMTTQPTFQPQRGTDQPFPSTAVINSPFQAQRSTTHYVDSPRRCRWRRGLNRRTAAARWLGLRVRVPPVEWLSFSCGYFGVLLLLVLLLTAIELSLVDKTNKNKYTYRNTVQTIQNTVNTSTHTTKIYSGIKNLSVALSTLQN